MRRRAFLSFAAAAAVTPLIASCAAKREGEMPPQDLLSFGKSFVLAEGAGAEQSVTLKERRGPAIDLPSGALALADPWFQEALPDRETIRLPRGKQPSLLSTIDFIRDGKRATMACAAAIGPVDRVTDWRPLTSGGKPFRLDSDSALGAFYDMADDARLRPLFENDQHMFAVYKRALKEPIATMDAEGGAAGVVFLCPDGSGLYPAYGGFDRGGNAVAALVDLKIL